MPGDPRGHRQLAPWKREGPQSPPTEKGVTTLLGQAVPHRQQSWANHEGFQKKSKSMPRKMKSGQHLINLLASSQGRSLQRGTSHGETPSPRHIYGNTAVNLGRGWGRESLSCSLWTLAREEEILFMITSASVTGESHS